MNSKSGPLAGNYYISATIESITERSSGRPKGRGLKGTAFSPYVTINPSLAGLQPLRECGARLGDNLFIFMLLTITPFRFNTYKMMIFNGNNILD
jgi:hypothetical protein